MRNDVIVVPSDKLIIVDGSPLKFDYSVIDGHNTLHALQWHSGSGHLEFTDDLNQTLQGEELYNQEVEPYVLLWETEKKRLDDIEAARLAEYNSLPNVKSRKIAVLKSIFAGKIKNSSFMSFVGYEINTGEDSLTFVNNLIHQIEMTGDTNNSVSFRFYDNISREISYADLLMIQNEITNNILELKQELWKLENQVNACTTVDEVNLING